MPTTLLLVENASVPRDPRVWAESQALRDGGWDVVVVCPQGEGEAGVETRDGIELRRFRPPRGGTGVRGYIAEYTRSLVRMHRAVRELARERRVDVVHAANPPDFLLLSAFQSRRRASFIFDHHDLSPELFAVKFGRRGTARHALLGAERLGFALADVVISTNESFRQIAIDRGRKRPEDVFVVRNGPDPEVFKPVDGDPGLRRGATYLLGYVGVMGGQDGVIEALHALAALRRRRTDWRAILVGEGDVVPEAKRLSASLGLSDAVEFVGFVSDRRELVQLIATCDVCLSPEPPNELNARSTLIKVAEYMAVARPVVAFELAETRATAGDAALYAATAEPSAYADAIDALLDDPGRRQRMGELGRRRVLEELGWSHSRIHLLAAYERATSHAAGRQGRS